MRTIDLNKGEHSLREVLGLAKSQAVLIRSGAGENFVLERADEFDREVAALGSSRKFLAFLRERSKETGRASLEQVRAKRGV